MARNVISARIGPGGSVVPVRLPKGMRNPSPAVNAALDDLAARKRLTSREGCIVALFDKSGKGRGPYVAAQRCDGRTLKAHNKKQCRAKAAKGTKNYKRFVKCR